MIALAGLLAMLPLSVMLGFGFEAAARWMTLAVVAVLAGSMPELAGRWWRGPAVRLPALGATLVLILIADYGLLLAREHSLLIYDLGPDSGWFARLLLPLGIAAAAVTCLAWLAASASRDDDEEGPSA